MRAYKVYIKDKFLDVIVEPSENGKHFLTPSDAKVSEDEHLRVYSEYEYTMDNKDMVEHFKNQLTEKGYLHEAASYDVLIDKIRSCGVYANAAATGIAYSIEGHNLNEIKVRLSIENHFNLGINEVYEYQNLFRVNCISID